VGNAIVTGLSYHPLPNRQNAIRARPSGLNGDLASRNKTAGISSRWAGYLMRRFILLLWLLTAALYPAPSSAQQRNQLGPLCTSDTTPADQQIDACNKIIALKVFSGEKLATIFFLARGRLKQEGQLCAGDRGCQRSDPARAQRSLLQSSWLRGLEACLQYG
jgi:hypothetical protein